MGSNKSRKEPLFECPHCNHTCESIISCFGIGQHMVKAHGPVVAVEWADSLSPTWRECSGGHSINSMKKELQRLSRKEGPQGFPAIAKPGEKVICVDQRFSGQVWEWTTALPSLWGIYTVQDVKWCPNGLTGEVGPAYVIKEMAPFLLGRLRFDTLHFVPMR
jgi:hypothetical protein